MCAVLLQLTTSLSIRLTQGLGHMNSPILVLQEMKHYGPWLSTETFLTMPGTLARNRQRSFLPCRYSAISGVRSRATRAATASGAWARENLHLAGLGLGCQRLILVLTVVTVS